MSDEANVEYSVAANGVATVRLNRPKQMNAVDSETERQLDQVFDQIAAAGSKVRCVVLTGTGERAFCAGADMKESGPSGVEYWSQTNAKGFGTLALRAALDVPIIARVNGVALGGGMELMLGCDLVVAAQHAKFGLPEPRVGRLPLDGMVMLPRRLPRTLALGMLLTGRMVAADEAAALGLVNEVVPASELDAAVQRWTDDILACAPLSLAAIKHSLRLAHLPIAEARATLTPALEAALRSSDADEGVAAFRGKAQAGLERQVGKKARRQMARIIARLAGPKTPAWQDRFGQINHNRSVNRRNCR